MTGIIIPIVLVFTYIAGRIDFLNVIVMMFTQQDEEQKEE